MIVEAGQTMKFSHKQLLALFDDASVKTAFTRLLAPTGTLAAASETDIKQAMAAPHQAEAQQAC